MSLFAAFEPSTIDSCCLGWLNIVRNSFETREYTLQLQWTFGTAKSMFGKRDKPTISFTFLGPRGKPSGHQRALERSTLRYFNRLDFTPLEQIAWASQRLPQWNSTQLLRLHYWVSLGGAMGSQAVFWETGVDLPHWPNAVCVRLPPS